MHAADDEVTAALLKEMSIEASELEKPEPRTETGELAGPEDGKTVRVGRVTLNIETAAFPDVSAAVTV